MTLLRDEWLKFVLRLGDRPQDIISGQQFIHMDQTWTVPGKIFMNPKGMTLQETGYTKSKIQQLERHYENIPTIRRAQSDLVWRVNKRKYGSGVWDFRGEVKKNTKQDYCMTAGVISYYPPFKSTRVTIYYRTVEVIKRFRGDLLFLRDVILPYFSEATDQAPISEIAFKFANCTFHPMFTILLVGEMADMEWVEYFDKMRSNNPRLFRDSIYWSWRYILDPEEGITKYSSGRQVKDIAERLVDHTDLTAFKRYLVKHMRRMPKGTFPERVERSLPKLKV